MTIYDLSVPIEDGTDWYHEEDTPPVRIERVGSLDKQGWVSHHLSLPVLNGTTYLETAAHLYADGPSIDAIPPDRLLTRAFVVRIEQDGRELLAPTDRLQGFRQGQDALILHCGWDADLRQDDFYDASPHFSKPLQEWVLDHNPDILGSDTPSLDHPADVKMPFLRAFFRRGGLILCPLVGVANVPSECATLCVAPLRLVGANAAPCRVYAWIDPDEKGDA